MVDGLEGRVAVVSRLHSRPTLFILYGFHMEGIRLYYVRLCGFDFAAESFVCAGRGLAGKGMALGHSHIVAKGFPMGFLAMGRLR